MLETRPAENGRPSADGAAVTAVPTDLRLLPAAVGAEAGALVGLLLPGRACVAVVLVALLLALLARLTMRRAAVLLALLLVLVGSAAGAGLRVESRRTGPVAVAAAAGRTADVTAVLTGDPRPTKSGVSGDALRRPTVTVPARLERMAFSGNATSVRAPVLLIAPADVWSGLLPTQRVTVSGRLAAPRGSDLAAVVLVRGPPEAVARPAWWQRLAGSLR